MTRQVIDGQMQEFLGQPDATARLTWLEELSPQNLHNATSSEETIETDNIIELALALKTEATSLMRDEPEKAQQIAGLTDEIAIWSKNPQVQAISDWTCGNARFFQGHHEECLERYQAALRYYEQADQQAAIIDLHINCASVQTYLSEYEQALHHLKYAQKSASIDIHIDIAIDLEMTLASIYGYLDRYKDAIEATKRGIALAQKHNFPTEEARLQINQSFALEGLGHFDEAILCLENAQNIFASTDEKLDEARTWLDLGAIRARKGEYRQALLDLDLAHRRFETLNNSMEMGTTDFGRAQVYLELNLLPETIELCKSSQATLQGEHGVRHDGALADYYAGIAYGRLEEVESARQHLEQASQNLQDLELPIQTAVVNLALARLIANLPSQETPFSSQNDMQADIPALQEAEALAQTASELFQIHNLTLRQLEAQIVLADIQRQREDDTDSLTYAQQNYQAVLASLAHNASSALDYRAYYGLGKLAELRGAADEALNWYGQAIDLITDTLLMLGESELRGGYLYNKLMIFQTAIALNLAQGREDDALHLIELARTGAWQTSTADVESSENSSPEVELSNINREQLRIEIEHLREQWRWYYQQLYGDSLSDSSNNDTMVRGDVAARRENRYSKELQQTERELRQALRTLRLHGPQTELDQSLTGLTLGKLRTQLRPQQCLLIYYVIDNKVMVFLITAKKTMSLTLSASWSDICFDLQKLYFTLNRFDEKTDKHLHRLWKKLFAPLLSHIENYTELTIIPHDQLYHLPFHALHDGDQPLLQCYQIQYAPTISWLLQSRKQEWGHSQLSQNILSPEQPTALIMAYSDKHSSQPIPAVVDEAKSIYQAWKTETPKDSSINPKPTLYIEEEALSTHLYEHADTCRLLHIAAHGKFRFDNPLFSALYLSDGPLLLADLEQLHFSAAPLVVLSACETGVSNIGGAGVLGISQAFLRAGASMVLVSLWRVEDQATAMLMQAFHRYLTTNLAPAQALRQSQMDLINDPKFSHPSYWAGWTLVG